MLIDFFKYEGAGNDFIVIDNRSGRFPVSDQFVARLCDRRFGIGADGLMLLEDDGQSEFRMRYFNSDGPESTMCGNGGRCIALFAHHLGIGDRVKRFIAADGLHSAEIVESDDLSGVVSLQMSDVEGVKTAGNGYLLNTGSPHYVEFIFNLKQIDVVRRGRSIRYDKDTVGADGANVNFVELADDNQITIRTYERGVEAETLACGTGAVASSIATALYHKPECREFLVNARGGKLKVNFTITDQDKISDILLTGPARQVFRGVADSKNFI